MNQNNLLATLQENRLMQTEEQVTNFENALAEIAENPDENNLSAYHLILDDQCQQPEVMFSLIHFLESLTLNIWNFSQLDYYTLMESIKSSQNLGILTLEATKFSQ